MRHKHLSDSAVSEQCPKCSSQLQLSSRGQIERAFWLPLSNTRGKPTRNHPIFIMLYGRSTRGNYSDGNPWFAG